MKLVKVALNHSGFYGNKEDDDWLKHKAYMLALAEQFKDYGVTYDKEQEDSTYPSLLKNTEILLSPEEYVDYMIQGVQFTAPEYLKTKSAPDGNPFEAVIAKMDEVLAMKVTNGDVNYNSKCEVSMPGQALSMYNQTLLCENCCTDELQANLLQGWRIIAACPQPDQRRPDYILGRFNPEEF